MSLVGDLQDLGLADIFQILAMSRRSGLLQLSTASLSGEILFRSGKVVAVFCNDQPQSVGDALVAAGLCSEGTLSMLLAQQAEGMSGLELLAAGKLNDDHAEAVMEEMLKQAVYRMFEWQNGTFCFTKAASIDPWRDFSLDGMRVVVERGLNPQYLSLEGARLQDESSGRAGFVALAPPVPLPADPAAATPTVAAPVAVPYDLNRELQSDFANVELTDPEAAQTPPSHHEIIQLRAVLAELRDSEGTPAICALLLRYASSLFERAVLFQQQEQTWLGMGGFAQHEAAENFAARVRRIRLNLPADNVLTRAMQRRAAWRGRLPPSEANKKILESLNPPPTAARPRRAIAQDALLAPLLTTGRVQAILYADNPSGKVLGSSDCLEIFLQQASLVLACQELQQQLQLILQHSHQPGHV